VLPDYEKFLTQGSAWLELAPPRDFDEALDALRILYHHVPSVTGMPVWLGRLDHLLLPFVGELDDETLHRKLKAFWIYLDRVLPDAFMHVNIGPDDNRICRLILRIDNELKQVAPTSVCSTIRSRHRTACCCKGSRTSRPAASPTSSTIRCTGTPSTNAALASSAATTPCPGRCQHPGAPLPQGRGRAERRG
jgi:hypothetical protein